VEFCKIDPRSYNIAGPLCFQGDFLVKDLSLPQVDAGDILIVLDTGAYTFSLYSRYARINGLLNKALSMNHSVNSHLQITQIKISQIKRSQARSPGTRKHFF
jgi:hypothetical protein